MKKLFLLMILLVGTSNTFAQTQVADSDTITSKITVHELGNVSVKGHRPLVKADGSKLIYDIPALAKQHASTNAYEAMLQVPGVYEQNGTLVLAGAGSVNLIINGKPTTMNAEQLQTLLKNMPASKLKQAEVMMSTPPQYHLRGASINLVLNNGLNEETHVQGETHVSYSQKHYAGMKAGGDLLFASPKLSVDLLYNADNSLSRSILDILTIHTVKDKTYNIDQNTRNKSDVFTHNVRGEVIYKFNDKDQLSATYTGQYSPHHTATEWSKGNISNSQNHKSETNYLHNFSIYFNHSENVKLGLDYTSYKSDNTQLFTDIDSVNATTKFTAQSGQKVSRLNTFFDFMTPLCESSKLTYGGKFSYATDANHQIYSNQQGSNLSDSYSKVREYTYDMYLGLNHSFSDKVKADLSINGEYYKIGNYDTWSFFPTANLSYVPSSSHIFQFAFSTDRTYPSYWEMQESVDYVDGYTEIYGNPSLRPSRDYSAELSYILHQKYVFSIGYDYNPDYSMQLAYLSPDRLALIYKTLNWDYHSTFSVSSIIPISIGSFLNSRFTVNAQYERAKDSHYYDMSFDRSKWEVYTGLNNAIKLSSQPNLRLNIDGYYISSPIQGMYDLTSLWSVSSGLKWTFAKSKAELTLKGDDLFNTGYCNVKMNEGNQRMRMNFTPNNRCITVSFVYRFGGYKEKDHKQLDTSRFGKK